MKTVEGKMVAEGIKIGIGASRFIGKPDLSDLIQAVDDFVLDHKGIIIHEKEKDLAQ